MTILIIGGGVFGLTSALALRTRGWSVTLLDQGRIPDPLAASTDISKVVRADYGADIHHTEMGESAIAGWRAWNARWGEALFHETGFLVMSRSLMRPGSFEQDSFELLRRKGHALRRFDSNRLAIDHPAWSGAGFVDGYFNPIGGWVESGRVVARLHQDALTAGVTVHEQVPFASLDRSAGRVCGANATDGRAWTADLTLMAAGAWTPMWLPHLQPVMWATGQPVFHFQPANPEAFTPPHFPVWAADIATTGWYGFPADRQGIVKVANHGPGRRMDASAPRTVDPADEERFRGFLRDSLPSLADAPVAATRLCLYNDTFDSAFWIDHDPFHPGLVVAAGDSGHAFKFAPVLGGLIADVVEGKPNAFAGRYRWREPQSGAADGARALA